MQRDHLLLAALQLTKQPNGMVKQKSNIMINQIFNFFNTTDIYMCIVNTFCSFNDLYTTVLDKFDTGTVSLGCPFCGIKPMDYIRYGYYTRTVIDLEPVLDKNGNIKFSDSSTHQKVSIARIQCTQDGSTHALLFNFLVPYSAYTIRLILFHLYQLYQSGISMESYCERQNISTDKMKDWIDHLATAIPFLQQAGLISTTEEPDSGSENGTAVVEETTDHLTGADYKSKGKKKKTLSYLSIVTRTKRIVGSSVKWFYLNFEAFYKAFLQTFRYVVFQKHASPSNTVYQFWN